MLKLGANVVGISIDIPTYPSLFDELKLSNKIKDYRFDVRDLATLMNIFDNVKPDFVFHLAAQPIVSLSYIDPVNTFSTNVMGTVNIMECLKNLENKCTAIIITSDKCYDNVEWIWGYKETDHLGGKDIYSGSKGAAEIAFKSYFYSFFRNHSNVRVASARAGNVIGGGDWAKDRIVPDCILAWLSDSAVEIRSPTATRPWQHVLEPLSGYLALGQELYGNPSLNGESFNFGPKSEDSNTVINLLEELSKHWNIKTLDKIYKITDNVIFHEAGLLKLNCDKALYNLKWLSTLNYEKLTSFTSTWYYEFYHNKSINIFDFTQKQIDEYYKLAIEKEIKWTL